MKVTSKMFNDNPTLEPKELFAKVSRERYKSTKRMPTKAERSMEREIVLLEKK